MTLTITILGCGPSGGVPLIGCHCSVCTSKNPKNQRSRVSVHIQHPNGNLLIDTSPDLRQQCLKNNITQVDSILYTHAHADHCHGIDDVRSLNYLKNGGIDTYGTDHTLSELKERFPYVFAERNPQYGWYKPLLHPHGIDEEAPEAFITETGVSVLPFIQKHGKMTTLGFRVENFAYSSDVNNLPENSFQAIDNIDLWVVDCLRYEPAPTHAHLDLALEWIERVKPKRAILTHMGHELEYEELKKLLPEHVVPAYDGMVVELA